jgi:glutamine synthetase
MSSLRFKAVEEAFKKKALEVTPPSKFTSDYYGKYVFNRATMAKYLSKDTLKSLKNVIDKGATLNLDIANDVAAGMRMWAMELELLITHTGFNH